MSVLKFFSLLRDDKKKGIYALNRHLGSDYLSLEDMKHLNAILL